MTFYSAHRWLGWGVGRPVYGFLFMASSDCELRHWRKMSLSCISYMHILHKCSNKHAVNILAVIKDINKCHIYRINIWQICICIPEFRAVDFHDMDHAASLSPVLQPGTRSQQPFEPYFRPLHFCFCSRRKTELFRRAYAVNLPQHVRDSFAIRMGEDECP